MTTATYDWQWRVQIAIPSPIKVFGSNNGTWAGAWSLYLSNQNFAGVDVSAFFRTMKMGDTVRVEHKTDASIWSLWTLAVPPIDYGSCFTFPASKVEVHGAPVDNTTYRVVLAAGVTQPTERISIDKHLWNLSVITSGMLNKENINLQTVGDDAILVYTRLVTSYLATPELPQPTPPPVLPKSVKSFRL